MTGSPSSSTSASPPRPRAARRAPASAAGPRRPDGRARAPARRPAEPALHLRHLRRRGLEPLRLRRGAGGRRQARQDLQPALHPRRLRARQDPPPPRDRQRDPARSTAAARVAIVSSERYTNEFVEALSKRHRSSEFRRKYRECDALLVDDVQFLAGKDKTAEEFFHTFNELHDHHVQIVLSSDRSPKELKGLDDRLCSRFEWGMRVQIDVAGVRDPGRHPARRRRRSERIELPDDGRRPARHPHQVERPRARGRAHARRRLRLAEGRADQREPRPRRPLATSSRPRATSRPSSGSRRWSRRTTASRCAKLTSPSREQKIALPRQVAMYLCRDPGRARRSSAIAEKFNKKDHTTVMAAREARRGELVLATTRGSKRRRDGPLGECVSPSTTGSSPLARGVTPSVRVDASADAAPDRLRNRRGRLLTASLAARYTNSSRRDRGPSSRSNSRDVPGRRHGFPHLRVPYASTCEERRRGSLYGTEDRRPGALAAPSPARRASWRRSRTMPILSHVLLEARKGDMLQVSATDLDLAVSSEHKGLRGPQGGRGSRSRRGTSTTSSARSPSSTVTPQEGPQQLPRGEERRPEFRIVGLPAEDFPALPRFEKVHLRRRWSRSSCSR